MGFCTGTAPPRWGCWRSAAAYDAGGEWLDGVLTCLDGNRRLLADLLAAQLPEIRYRLPEGTLPGLAGLAGLGLSGAVGGFYLEKAGVALVDGPGAERLVRVTSGQLATGRALLTTMVGRMAAGPGFTWRVVNEPGRSH